MGVVNEPCEDISINVIMSTPSVVSCDMQVDFEEREPKLQPASTLALKEHIIIPSSVSCDVQVAFE